MAKHKFKEKVRKGQIYSSEQLRESMKDTAEQKQDSLENYGGDKIEDSAQYAVDKAVDTVADIGEKVKNKITEKVRDKLTEDRPKEENPKKKEKETSQNEQAEPSSEEPVTEPTKPESTTQEKVQQSDHRDAPREETLHGSRASRSEDIRENRIKEKTDDVPADRSENYFAKHREYPSQERTTPREENNCLRIKEKPEAEREAVKTKNSYMQSQNHEKVHEHKAEVKTSSSPEPAKNPPKAEPKATGSANSVARKPASTGKSYGVRTVRCAEQTAGNAVKESGKGTVKTAGKASVKTAQASVKTAQTSVKTAEQTGKVTVKTAKTTAKVAQKAAQAAAKAAKATAQAIAKGVKVAAKAVATAVKAIAAAIKGIIAAIAAGGWVAVVVIVVIAVVAVIVCACCGVFASNETADGSKPMTEAIRTIDSEFRTSISDTIEGYSESDYDEVVVEYVGDMDGDSEYCINWNDVIAIYSVVVTMDEIAPTDVVQVTPEKVVRLRNIFYDMNHVYYDIEVIRTEETVENDYGEEETVTHKKLIISVDVESMDAYEAAELYMFDEDKMEALEVMMEPQMLPLYAELMGVDVYGGADLTKIISGLPAGTMGTDVLNVALTKVGAPYVLGAKGPTRFDCSGLVYWSIKEIDPELGRNLYTSAGYQYKYCRDNNYLVGESEARPGDLIFWQKPGCHCGKKYNEIHHIGFYLGDGMILDASSSNGRVIIRKLFSGSSYRVYAYARPYSY